MLRIFLLLVTVATCVASACAHACNAEPETFHQISPVQEHVSEHLQQPPQLTLDQARALAQTAQQATYEAANALMQQSAHAIVIAPLRSLYFHGPTLGGYGFWGGAAPADACAQLTGMPATTWLASAELERQCAARLDRKFWEFATAVCFAAYAWTLVSLCAHLWFRHLVLRPTLAEIQRVFARAPSPQSHSRPHSQLQSQLQLQIKSPHVKPESEPKPEPDKHDTHDLKHRCSCCMSNNQGLGVWCGVHPHLAWRPPTPPRSQL